MKNLKFYSILVLSALLLLSACEEEKVQSQYDYDVTLNYLYGYLFLDSGDSEEDNFYFCLSDLGFDDEGNPQSNGAYYVFDIYVNESDGGNLPAGTYTYESSSSGGDMVFDSYCFYGDYDTEFYFTDGTITVSAEGDSYTIEGVLTDEEGGVHHIRYSGPVELETIGIVALEGMDFDATTSVAICESSSGSVMDVIILFTDMNFDGYYVSPPGNYLVLMAYMPYDADGKIAVGTYEVSNTNDSMTILSGDGYNESVAIYFESDYYYKVGYIASGEMSVTEEAEENNYTIECDFLTYDGAAVKSRYTGELVVQDVSAYSSSSFKATETKDVQKEFSVKVFDLPRAKEPSKTFKVQK